MQLFSANNVKKKANKKLKKNPQKLFRNTQLVFNKILTFTVGNDFISVLFHHDLFVAKLRCAWNYEKTAEDFLLLLHLLYQFTREEVKEYRRTFMSELRL